MRGNGIEVSGPAAGADAEAAFDGVICIGGEDWWYHNRGHFDFQIMRRIARDMPVLFVNSLGVRVPNPLRDRHFSQRIARKLTSYARGLVEAEPGFWVFSPVVVPGARGKALTDWALAPQIRLAAHRAGITNPALWLHCPPGADLIGRIPARLTVMQRTDRFEAFPDGDHITIARQIGAMKQAADLIVYCNDALAAEDSERPADRMVVTHGVDLERFASAGQKRRATDWAAPDDIAGIPSPRIGFIGGVDHHTFDPPLFLEVADRIPDAHFVVVGGCSLPSDWVGSRQNIHIVGRKPYDVIADYMAAMDVLIMPWNRSDWIAACNPIKLKEYLAVQRPVVTTDFPALGPWRDRVAVANTAEAFADACREALSSTAADVSSALATETWDHKSAAILSRMHMLATARRDADVARIPERTRLIPATA
ncbi:MAG: glycosyltransferase [Pseudomonadota bacterium]